MDEDGPPTSNLHKDIPEEEAIGNHRENEEKKKDEE